MAVATKQAQLSEIDLEPCINCPLYKKHVPIDGNCLELQRAGCFGYLAGGFESYFSDEDNQPHPISEIVTLPIMDGSKEIITVFKTKPKCVYYHKVRVGLKSRAVRSVFCSYQMLNDK